MLISRLIKLEMISVGVGDNVFLIPKHLISVFLVLELIAMMPSCPLPIFSLLLFLGLLERRRSRG